jgi:hypothetical protein
MAFHKDFLCHILGTVPAMDHCFRVHLALIIFMQLDTVFELMAILALLLATASFVYNDVIRVQHSFANIEVGAFHSIEPALMFVLFNFRVTYYIDAQIEFAFYLDKVQCLLCLLVSGF